MCETVLRHVCIPTGSQQLQILNISLLPYIILLPCSRATSHKEGNCFHKTNKSVQSCESLLPAFTSLFLDSTFIPPFLSPPPSLLCALFDSLSFRISLTDFLHANTGTREYLLTDFSCTAQLIFTDSQRTKPRRQTQLGLSLLSVCLCLSVYLCVCVRVQSGPVCC